MEVPLRLPLEHAQAPAELGSTLIAAAADEHVGG